MNNTKVINVIVVYENTVKTESHALYDPTKNTVSHIQSTKLPEEIRPYFSTISGIYARINNKGFQLNPIGNNEYTLTPYTNMELFK
jgi:hypothetical protein